MEVFFGHEFFGDDILPWKPWSLQLESCLLLKERCLHRLECGRKHVLYVLEEEAVWKIGVLVEV